MVMIMVTMIVTILIMAAVTIMAMILFTIADGIHPLYLISVLETDGTTIITHGTGTTMDIMITITCIIRIIIITITLQTDIQPQHILHGGIPATILNLPHVMIIIPGGIYLQETHHAIL